MLRWAWRISCAISLALCLATATMWVRSYWVDDVFFARDYTELSEKGFNREYQLETLRGRAAVQLAADNLWLDINEPTIKWNTKAAPAEGFASTSAYAGPSGVAHDYLAVSWLKRPHPAKEFPLLLAGHELLIQGPLWAPTAIFGTLPLIWIILAIRWWKKRRRPGLCRHCGYDLRASCDRCPECGNSIGPAPLGPNRKGLHYRPRPGAVLASLAIGGLIAWTSEVPGHYRRYWAAWSRYDQMLKQVSEATHAARVAISDGNPLTLRRAFERGARLPAHTMSMGMVAATYNNDPEVAIELLKHGADPNIAPDAVELDDSAHGVHNGTALAMAAENGQFELMKLLVEKGADVNVKNSLGYTPLHECAGSVAKLPDLELPRLLLKHGADPNARGGEFGSTPLHCLALDPQETERGMELAELLIRSGADLNAKDVDGDTPLKAARVTGHRKMAEFLRRHGAKE